MEKGTRLCFFLLLSTMIGHARGYDFYVGGRSGWVTSPSESYSSWSGRMRFSVNDSLVFIYDNSVDSVLEVTNAGYSSCNAANPITRLATGRDTFKLPRSGPFYFISGNATHCQAGQKLLVVVLAIRSPPSSPSPPGAAPPPGSTKPGGAPAPTGTPSASAPAPPGPTQPGRAPTPGGSPTASAPTPANTPPATAPATAGTTPAPASPSLAPSSASSPSPPTGGSGLAPSSQSAPGSTTSPPSSGSGSAPGSPDSSSAGSPPPPPPPGTSATSRPVPRSFPAILAAAILALFGRAFLQ